MLNENHHRLELQLLVLLTPTLLLVILSLHNLIIEKLLKIRLKEYIYLVEKCNFLEMVNLCLRKTGKYK